MQVDNIHKREAMINELKYAMHHVEMTPEQHNDALDLYIDLVIQKSKQNQMPLVADLAGI